jgi:DNA-binding CsgD family transcriptional regulator
MPLREHLPDLTRRLCLAPGTRDGWRAFLERLCGVVNGAGASFLTYNFDTDETEIAAGVGTGSATLHACLQYWRASEPWVRLAEATQRDTCSVLAAREELSLLDGIIRRSATDGHTADLCCVARLVDHDPRCLLTLVITGKNARCDFGAPEAALIEALVPNIRATVRLERQLMATRARSDDLHGVLDGLLHGVVLVDADGHATFTNRLAKQIADERDGFAIDGGTVRASKSQDTLRLHSLLARITTSEPHEASSDVLALTRPSGRRALVALISPLPEPRAMQIGRQRPVALITISDPERGGIPDAPVIRAVLGLTIAEARLARLLAQGYTLEQTARRQGLRMETVRTRLKTVFEKTSTHRQVELVSLILRAIPQRHQ